MTQLYVFGRRYHLRPERLVRAANGPPEPGNSPLAGMPPHPSLSSGKATPPGRAGREGAGVFHLVHAAQLRAPREVSTAP